MKIYLLLSSTSNPFLTVTNLNHLTSNCISNNIPLQGPEFVCPPPPPPPSLSLSLSFLFSLCIFFASIFRSPSAFSSYLNTLFLVSNDFSSMFSYCNPLKIINHNLNGRLARRSILKELNNVLYVYLNAVLTLFCLSTNKLNPNSSFHDM